MKKVFVVIIGLICILSACSQSSRIDTDYLGTWRLKHFKQHTILSLRNNGTFEVDLRIEGQLSKIIAKKGTATGTWETSQADNSFSLNITQGDASIGWPEGISNYSIRQMDGKILLLVSTDGKEYLWEKVRHQKADSPVEADYTSITLAPLIVNLSPSKIKAHQRYKWLCTALDIVLVQEDNPPHIRPQWKEKIIFLLSSKTYADLNTQAKLMDITHELRDLINPYMGGRVVEVIFKRVVVTGRKEAVEKFSAEYEPKDK